MSDHYTPPTPAINGTSADADDVNLISEATEDAFDTLEAFIAPENEATDTTCFITFVTGASGIAFDPKTNANLTFDSSSGILTAAGFAGPLTGNITGNVTGKADNVADGDFGDITVAGGVWSIDDGSHTIVSHDTTATGAQLNTLVGAGDADSLHTHNLKANLAGPTFTGTVTVPSTNFTIGATTFSETQLGDLTDSGHSTLHYHTKQVGGILVERATDTTVAKFVDIIIPASMNGMELSTVIMTCTTAGVTGTMVGNIEKNGTDMLSTGVSIDTTETTSVSAATPYVVKVDGTEDVATGDVITMEITGIHSGTAAKGCIIVLEFI